MDWVYGKMMLKQGDINSLAEWSDDLEVACSIMDERFDYLWSKEGKGLRFTDRLLNVDIADRTVQERLKNGEATLKFGSFEDVFKWILKRTDEDVPYRDWMAKRIKGNKIKIWRSYAVLDNSKVIELLWDDEREVENYFYGLMDYSRCKYVTVVSMESQPDHVIKDVACLFEYERKNDYEN